MKILVVDDEQDIKMLFEQRFRREIRSGEFSFVFCFSGEEALTFLQEHPSEAILILSDINMPGMSGLELLSKIREKSPTPPPVIMMITAYGNPEKQEEAMRLGADAFMEKPIDFKSLKTQLLQMS